VEVPFLCWINNIEGTGWRGEELLDVVFEDIFIYFA
jgi:hypothetical protein